MTGCKILRRLRLENGTCHLNQGLLGEPVLGNVDLIHHHLTIRLQIPEPIILAIYARGTRRDVIVPRFPEVERHIGLFAITASQSDQNPLHGQVASKPALFGALHDATPHEERDSLKIARFTQAFIPGTFSGSGACSAK
jgi:hypothetical protein